MPVSSHELAEESKRATEILREKVVAQITRHREQEVLIEFTDGTRLFVDGSEAAIELSITGGASK